MANSGTIAGIGLVVVGAIAVVAAPFSGGASLYLYAAGTAASLGGGFLLSASAEQPEPISGVSRQTQSTSDPESPRETVYGTVVKGGLLTWVGVGGGEDALTGSDFVLAAHPCNALLAVQIGDYCFPVTTDPDGDPAYNGLGIILNTGQTLTDVFPADWYVPVRDSPWWANPQDDKHSGDRPHLGIKFSPGNRTATEPWMIERFGTDYSEVARKYTGLTVVSVITRVHDELNNGGLQDMLWRIEGKSNVQNHTGGSPQFRDNAAHVFADYVREKFGIPVTDVVNLQTAATECDDTTWSGSGGAKKYVFDGVIRDDEDPIDVMARIARHFAGGYSERGDKIVLWTGTVKTPWADGPLTYDDLAGPITITPPDEDSWINTLLPHFIVHQPSDNDGSRFLLGKMEPARNEVTSATYVTEDGGVILRQDAKFDACRLGRRAKFMAWILLKQSRLGASMDIVAKKRAIVLEVGDVLRCSFPDFFPNNTLFQVMSKSFILSAESIAVRLGLVRYEDGIFIPDVTPTEDAIGIVPRRRSTILPQLTGLAADEEEDTGQINGNGFLIIDVVVSWDLSTSSFVRSSGSIRVAWKRQTATVWKSITAAGDDIQTVIPGLRQSVPYHIRVRAEGFGSAGQGSRKLTGRWSDPISFTPDTGLIERGPPGTGVTGANEVVDGNFENGLYGNTWDLVDESGTLPGGAATIENTGGKYGKHRLMITGNPTATNQFYRARSNFPIAVTAGEWRQFKMAVKKRGTSNNIEAKMVALFYDDQDPPVFVSARDVIRKVVSNTAWQASRRVGETQVPGDATISSMVVEVRMESETSSGESAADFDGFSSRELIKMSTPKVETLVSVADGTWTNLVSLEGFDSGLAETQIYFDGESAIEFSAYVEASVKRGGFSDVTAAGARAVARIRLETVGGGTVTICDQKRVAVLRPGEVAATESGDVEARRLVEYFGPAAGNYKVHLEGRCVGDTTNGTAQFHRYWIRLVK